ncbi:MAG TPA: hypothetical protein VK611_09160 [Acidimicrobiales bacterium]|nr:hypothetical protein [Acidimicrobiales bacterium]
MRHEDRECTVRAAALPASSLWRSTRLLVAAAVAVAVWFWLAEPTAADEPTEPATTRPAGLADVVDDVLQLVPATTELVDDVLTPIVDPVVEPLQTLLPPVFEPEAPAPVPTAPAIAPEPPSVPAARPLVRTVAARRAPRRPPVVQAAAGPGRHDERAWALDPVAPLPPGPASTPAAGVTTRHAAPTLRADRSEPTPTPSPHRPPSGSADAVPCGPGPRTDRGPQVTGTPGARAALVAASTAAQLGAAVEAPEDRPASRPPTTPD